MVKKGYVPDRGDLVWLDFDPQVGHEQRGKRPALVVSIRDYNEKTNLGLFCPITSMKKDYPFEVVVSVGKINGVILSDQIKSLDWKKRNARYIGKVEESIIGNVLGKIQLLIEQ
jgi:mRNA interferase MazF